MDWLIKKELNEADTVAEKHYSGMYLFNALFGIGRVPLWRTDKQSQSCMEILTAALVRLSLFIIIQLN